MKEITYATSRDVLIAKGGCAVESCWKIAFRGSRHQDRQRPGSPGTITTMPCHGSGRRNSRGAPTKTNAGVGAGMEVDHTILAAVWRMAPFCWPVA